MNKPDDLQMMEEWATALVSRIETMDLRHAKIALDWFQSFAASAIDCAEKSRLIAAVIEGAEIQAKEKQS